MLPCSLRPHPTVYACDGNTHTSNSHLFGSSSVWKNQRKNSFDSKLIAPRRLFSRPLQASPWTDLLQSAVYILWSMCSSNLKPLLCRRCPSKASRMRENIKQIGAGFCNNRRPQGVESDWMDSVGTSAGFWKGSSSFVPRPKSCLSLSTPWIHFQIETIMSSRMNQNHRIHQASPLISSFSPALSNPVNARLD